MFKFYVVYMIIMNLLAFVLMGLDKYRAMNGQWRIPEVTLLGLNFFGGCAGGFLAMHLFRHKTRHARFFVGIPVMLVMHVVVYLIVSERFA